MLAAQFAPDTRTAVRHTAAVLAGVVAFLYVLIGLQVVTVIDVPSDQPAFALPAAVAFGVVAALLAFTDRRIVWVVAAVFVGFVIAMYFGVAERRSPQFETWGILLRVVQVPLLCLLGYLAATTPQPPTAPR
jgi:predicted permease